MKPIGFVFSLTMLLVFFLNGCASFPRIHSGTIEVQSEDAYIHVAFSDNDRRLIHDYYRKESKHKGLPPGLAKKKKLPPGLQKQLQKNGTLPPGLAKRSLPYELERRLSPIPEGYVRLRVGGDVILMNGATEVIVDIIHDISNQG